ncbi:MAG: DNA translocase FtsK 4TM domain-containing protein, partial [Kiritimatiellaeota bacterium]|nr:DNA translocase FtsK 4TM domain-containing protein [Kiritimatiellota bacterium]
MDFTPPPSRLRIFLLPVIFLYSLVSMIGLVSFDVADIPSLDSEASFAVIRNMAGLFGARNSWWLLRLTGFASFLVPVFCLIVSVLILRGRKAGWRLFRFVFWALVCLLGTAGLLQFAGGFFNPLLESGGRFNIPFIGGGLGWFVTDNMTRWIGVGGAAGILGLALLVSLVMMIGPGVIAEYFFTLRARGLEAERQVEEAVDEAIAKGESPAEARRRVKEEERQRRVAERIAARAAAQTAKEEERERKHAEKEALKAEKLAKREAERILRKMKPDKEAEEDEDAAEVIANTAKADRKAAAAARAAEVARAAVNANKTPAAKPEPAAPPAPAGPTFAASEVDFSLPRTQILAPVPKVATDEGAEAEIAENISVIQNTLHDFGIEVEVTDVIRGPVITCYEVKTPPGVKVDRISSYSNDLQMNLKAKSLRILSPIPGKSVMGIEVPNKIRRSVSLREVVESHDWKAAVQS